jgi:hypothetical protein
MLVDDARYAVGVSLASRRRWRVLSRRGLRVWLRAGGRIIPPLHIGWPWAAGYVMVGSIKSLRSARSRAKVRS